MHNHQQARKIRQARRAQRTRAKIIGSAVRPRAAIFRSLKHVAIQLIDDDAGKTLCSASDKEIKATAKMKKQEIAMAVGKLIATKAQKAKIVSVVFDRRGYQYHGRVQAAASGMREGGLQF